MSAKKEKQSIKSLVKKLRIDYILTSLLCIALGVAFAIFKDSVFTFAGIVLAAVMILIGIVNVIIYIVKAVKRQEPAVASMALGAAVIVIGIWILLKPEEVWEIIPMIIGVIMIAHGARALRESLVARKLRQENYMWVITLVLAILNIALGVVCIVDAFGVLELIAMVFGVALIFHGVTNLFTAIYAIVAEKKSKAPVKEPVDTTFKEDEN